MYISKKLRSSEKSPQKKNNWRDMVIVPMKFNRGIEKALSLLV